MSVLIQSMDMPTDGEMLSINIYPNGKVCIAPDLKCRQVATAVQVPPHGRLIDADNAIKQISELVRKAETDGFASAAAWYTAFIRHIELAPTITAESKEHK